MYWCFLSAHRINHESVKTHDESHFIQSRVTSCITSTTHIRCVSLSTRHEVLRNKESGQFDMNSRVSQRLEGHTACFWILFTEGKKTEETIKEVEEKEKKEPPQDEKVFSNHVFVPSFKNAGNESFNCRNQVHETNGLAKMISWGVSIVSTVTTMLPQCFRRMQERRDRRTLTTMMKMMKMTVRTTVTSPAMRRTRMSKRRKRRSPCL